MSAEVLRRAASLMRERAEAAEQGVWTALVDAVYVNPAFSDEGWLIYDATVALAVESEDPVPSANLTHIASWHPAVALAVADWLEKTADLMSERAATEWAPNGVLATGAAHSVARRYLGEPDPDTGLTDEDRRFLGDHP